MITKEEAYHRIEELVTRFGEQIDDYKRADYNETVLPNSSNCDMALFPQ